MYYSVNKTIFQVEPKQWETDQLHKPRSFTRSIQSWWWQASKERSMLLENEKLLIELRGFGYTFKGGFNHHDVLPPSQVASVWRTMSLKLKRDGVIAYFVREPTKENKVHYHFLFSSQHNERDLTLIFNKAKPEGVSGHTWFKPISPPSRDWINYILKVGPDNGNFRNDPFGKKRLLFVPNVGFDKVGFIGRFWLKKRAELWKAEQQIAETLESDEILELCKWLDYGCAKKDSRIGLTFNQIKRIVAQRLNEPYMQSLLAKFRRFKAHQIKQE